MISRVVIFFFLTVAGLSLFVQHKLSSQNILPVSIVLPNLPVFPPSKRFTGLVEKIGTNDLIGPESLVTSTTHDGVMFAALGDGRVVRIKVNAKDDTIGWTTLIRTGQVEGSADECGTGGPSDETDMEAICGRPLGLLLVQRSTVDPNFEGTEEDALLVADSYKGLLVVTGLYGDSAEFRVLATRADIDEEEYGFHLLNALVQAPDGSIYMTETSKAFYRRRIFHAFFDGRPTGRLLRYKKGQAVEVMADSLFAPNGIVLSHSGDSLLIVAAVQVLRYDLARQEMDSEPFVRVMPGTGDNIKRFSHLPSGEPRRCYWAGLGSKYAQPFSLLKTLSEMPKLRAFLVALLPYRKLVALIPKLSAFAVFDEEGNLIETYQDVNAAAPWLSEAEPLGGYLYLASWFNPFLGRVRVDDLAKTSSSV